MDPRDVEQGMEAAALRMADEVEGGDPDLDLDPRPRLRLPWGLRPGPTLAVVAAGYLAGSVPAAVVAGRRLGADPRAAGDRNPGFWNARGLFGVRRALPVFAADMLKGTAAGLAGVAAGGGASTYVGVGAAMVGHAFPVFAGWRGGRSVLTFVGGLAAISPPTFALSWGVCLATTAASGSFAYGARAGVFSAPLVQLAVERDPHRVAATGALMTFIGLRFAAASRAAGRSGRASSAPAAGLPR